MYRKSLLALMILATFSVTAATDKTITVTTLEDEDGENTNACSLREAIKAATDNRAYGGCSGGQLDITDQIKLKAGTYKLKKTLIVGSNLAITGDDAANYEAEDTYTGMFPARSDLKTRIEGDGSFGLFDTTAGRSGLTLNNVILSKGKNAYGGAIRAGGPVTLSRVYILDSVANISGGAVYLEGVNANLTASDVLFKGNNATRGAVIGMSCIDNLGWTNHSVALERNSIIDNGSATAKNIIEYCGTAVSTISASTIAQNTSNDSTLKFTHDEANKVYVLSPSSSLVLNSSTIVQNTTNSVLLYDNVGRLSLTGSILAYNKGGKSCRYGVANPGIALKDLKTSTVSAALNAVKLPTTTGSQDDVCDLPGHIYTANTDKFVNVSNITFSSLLNNLSPLKDGILPFYLPKPKLGGTNAINLIDAAERSCSTNDQRGVLRNIESIGSEVASNNKCDIGSIEISNLYAADVNTVNASASERANSYEKNIKFYEDLLASDDLDSKVVNRYKQFLREDQAALKAFKVSLAYRQAYANIFDVSTALERYSDDQTSTTFDKFADDKYNVIVESLGRGSQLFIDNKDEALLNTQQKANISCVWNPDLKQVLIRRTDNIDGKPQAITTPAGEYEYCKYTLQLKSDKSIQSTGYVQAQIVNIAPVANNDEFTIKYGSNQQIDIDVLANDNDDGDGGPTVKGYPDQRTPFFKDLINGRFANIKLLKKPQLGKLSFEYEQPCPDNSATRPEETCYGGKITYKANNTFSTFNDSFSYKVLDADLLESNEAEVKLINTATTTDDTRGNSGSSSGGGGGSSGGSLGLGGLFGLFGLAWLRRKMKAA